MNQEICLAVCASLLVTTRIPKDAYAWILLANKLNLLYQGDSYAML